MALAKTFMFALFLAVMYTSEAQLENLGLACDLNEEAIMKMGMECMKDEPALMWHIMEHMDDPDSMANMKFMCSNQKAVVDVLVCMEGKLSTCLPKEAQGILAQMFSKERLYDVIGYVCKHKEEMSSNCGDSATIELNTCLKNNAAALFVPAYMGTMDMNQALCSVETMFNDCLDKNHGTCGPTTVEDLKVVFKKLIPAECSGLKSKPASKLLDALMVHGQPSSLKFQPSGDLGQIYQV